MLMQQKCIVLKCCYNKLVSDQLMKRIKLSVGVFSEQMERVIVFSAHVQEK